MSATPETPSENPTPSEPNARRPRDATPEAEAPLCPQCGYDLRGISSRRCPECGMAIDRTAHLHSRIPWTYRAAKGRIRTYLHTVLLMTAGTRRFRDEIARPVSYRDARRFWLVTATIVALPMLLLALAGSASSELDLPTGVALSPFGGMVPRVGGGTPGELSQWAARDVLFPTAIGMKIVPLIAVATVAMVLTNLAVLPLLLNRKSAPPVQRARAVAISYYACAPLVWWPILTALTLAGIALTAWGIQPTRGRQSDAPAIMVAIALPLAWAVPMLLTLFRSAFLYAAFRHAGVLMALWGGAQLVSAWLLNALFWLGVVPWLFGLIWVLWRSL